MGKKYSKRKLDTESCLFYLLMLIILVATVCCAALPYRNLGFDNEDCILLEEGWEYINPDGRKEMVCLPFQLERNMEQGVRVSRTLPYEHSYNANMIALWASMQYVTAYLDGEKIYSYTDAERPKPNYGKVEGSSWHVIRLPAGWEGKNFSLEITSPYPDYIGKIKSIYLGTKASFMYRIIHNYGVDFLISVITILVGGIFLAVHGIMKRPLHVGRGLSYLGWFQIWIGIWMLSECGLLQFVSGNVRIMHMLSFISIMVFPVPLLLFFKGIRGIHAAGLFQGLAFLHMLNIAGVLLLQVLDIADFYETLFFTHLLLILTAVVIFGAIVWEKFRFHNMEMKYLFSACMALIICGCVELFCFYNGERLNTGKLFNVGIFYFLVIMSYKTLRQTYMVVVRGNEAKYYEKLATVDYMTRCQNKTAYLKFMDEAKTFIQKKRSIYIVMADLNNLKQLNDSYGHHMGDDAIRLCAMILKEYFGEYGECYRMGGDEFLCICCDCGEEEIQERVIRVNEICDRESREWGHDFQVALGYARFNPETDRNLEDAIKRADDSMYLQKRKMKTV